MARANFRARSVALDVPQFPLLCDPLPKASWPLLLHRCPCLCPKSVTDELGPILTLRQPNIKSCSQSMSRENTQTLLRGLSVLFLENVLFTKLTLRDSVRLGNIRRVPYEPKEKVRMRLHEEREYLHRVHDQNFVSRKKVYVKNMYKNEIVQLRVFCLSMPAESSGS